MKRIILIFIISITAFLVSSLPVFYGLIKSPKDMEFRGYYNSAFLSRETIFIPQTGEGNFLQKNLFTSEIQSRLLVPLSEFPMVVMSKMFILSNFWILHLGRLIYIILFIVIYYYFLKRFIKTEKHVWMALTITVFSSGFGFILKPFITASADLAVQELNIFRTIAYSPPLLFNESLILLSLLFLFKSNKKYIGGIILGMVALDIQYIPGVIVILFALFLSIIYQEKDIRKSFTQIKMMSGYWFVPLLVVCINFFILFGNENIRLWLLNSYFPSLSFTALISGLGIMGYLAFRKIISKDIRSFSFSERILIFWIFAGLFFLYLPFPIQRAFGMGIQIPLIIIAFKSLTDLLSKRFYNVIIVFVMLSATVFGLYEDIKNYGDYSNNSYFYIYKEDIKALEWLRKRTNDNDVIFADAIYSPIIPGEIGRSVYFGNEVGIILTGHANQKKQNAKDFFFKFNDAKREKFLNKNRITYFYLGKKASSAEDFKEWDKKNYLKKVYEGDGTKIFKVIY